MLVLIQVDGTKQGLNDLKTAENTLKNLIDILRIDELDLRNAKEDIKKQIDKLVEILPNQREVYTEYVNCLDFLTKLTFTSNVVRGLDQLVELLENKYSVKVSKSSTFYQCFVKKKSATNALASENDKKSCTSPEPRNHIDITSLTIMAVKKIQILGRYNDHLFEHGLIFDFVKKTKQSKLKMITRFHNIFKGPRCIKHEM
uniref:Dolichyl-diphosphooligosaccharide--protein glycosyltransferase subunit 2 n=1 Tax=Schistosoma mansoni TaxID=6183 RepID=A0A5K4F9K5_SCHMA